MNEYERAFVSDCREKKQVARSASHMKRGSRSRACSLPSDALTPSQLKKMNGAVDSYSLNYFYTWAEFRALPDDIQVEWINHMSKKYDCGYTAIAKIVLNTSASSIRQYFERKGTLDRVEKRKLGATAEQRKALACLRDDLAVARGEVIDLRGDKFGVPATKQSQDTTITAARLELNRFDFDAVKMLANMFAGKSVTVTIDVQEVKNGE